MRRTTPGVEVTLSRACPDLALDPARVVRALEPLVTETRRARITEVIGRRLGSITVAFDAPYDPHNGAAVARSCEAFGVQEMHVVERANTPFAVAASVARGAQKWIDVVRHGDDASFLAPGPDARAARPSSRPTLPASSCRRTSSECRSSRSSSATSERASGRAS